MKDLPSLSCSCWDCDYVVLESAFCLWSWHLPWPSVEGRRILVNARNKRKIVFFLFSLMLPSTWCYDVMTPGKLVLLGHFVDIDRWISYSVFIWMIVFVPALARSAHQSIPLNLICLWPCLSVNMAVYNVWGCFVFFFSQSCPSSLNQQK